VSAMVVMLLKGRSEEVPVRKPAAEVEHRSWETATLDSIGEEEAQDESWTAGLALCPGGPSLREIDRGAPVTRQQAC
jgi:hypothetical protein